MHRLTVGIAVALILLALHPIAGQENAVQVEEPTYEGKTISQWIEVLKSPSWVDRSRAANSLGAIGPAAKAAVCSLRRALLDEHYELCKANAEAIFRITGDLQDRIALLTEQLHDPNWTVRSDAAYELGEIEPKTQDVVSALTAALMHDTNWKVRNAAARAWGGSSRRHRMWCRLSQQPSKMNIGVSVSRPLAASGLEAAPIPSRLSRHLSKP